MIEVGVSFGKLGLLNDGLGEFSVQVGRRLAARARWLREVHGIRLTFHLPPARAGLFGDEVAWLPARGAQKVLHWAGRRFDLWHSLHQHNRFRPPLGARRRVTTGHDLNFLYVKQGLSRLQALRRTRSVLARTDHLVTISDHVRRDFVERLGWGGPVRVIHNGARDLTAGPDEPVPGLEGRPFFFHLSRMFPSKNPQALLDLAAAWPERTFVLGGPRCDHAEGVEAAARARGLANVTVLYDVSDARKAWLYRHCEAFLFPSLTEGFGLPPIEAMHFGKPVFLSDRTSLPEVGGEVASYWHDFDPASMRRVVEAGLRRHAAEGLAARARARAATFDWDRCVEAYLALYLELLGLAPPAAG